MILMEDLHETVCVLQGRIAESRAKALLVQERMNNLPHVDWSEDVEALELEMLQICTELDEVEAIFSANIPEYTGHDQFSPVG